MVETEEPKKEPSEEVRTVEDYIRDARMFGDVPKDQFGHQFKLLWHPQSAPKTQMDLLPPDAILGIIKDSKSLLLLQNDLSLLNRFFDMGKRSEGIMDLFNSLFYPWWQQVRMTGALGGNERWLQSFLEPPPISYEGFSYIEKRKMQKAAKKQGLAGMIQNFKGDDTIYE